MVTFQHALYVSEVDIVSGGRVIATVEAGKGQEGVATYHRNHSTDMLEELELVVEHKGFDIEYIHYRCRLVIRKARGKK